MVKKALYAAMSCSVFAVSIISPGIVSAQTVTTSNAFTTTAASNTATTAMTPSSMQKDASSIHSSVMEARLQAQTRRKQAVDTLKQKLSVISDETKQQIVEKIDTRIQTVNQNRTDEWSTALDRLDTILSKIEDKKAEFATSGADLTTPTSDITAATTAISTAKAAVSVQAGKVYAINIVSDATLRSTVGQTVTLFKTDMVSTHQSVMAAKEAVVKAAQDVNQLAGSSNTGDSPEAAVAQ